MFFFPCILIFTNPNIAGEFNISEKYKQFCLNMSKDNSIQIYGKKALNFDNFEILFECHIFLNLNI